MRARSIAGLQKALPREKTLTLVAVTRSLSFVLLVACMATAQAAMIAIAPSKDNTLYEDGGGSYSNGSGEVLFAGVTGPFGGLSKRRAVMAFDIAGSLPEGAIIESVSLRIHTLHSGSSAIANFFLHAMLGDWGEGTSNAGPTGGTGVAAQPGDATWIHSHFGSALWTNAGGDFHSDASAEIAVSTSGFYEFSGPGLLADVEAWLANPASNFGWLIKGEELGELFSARRISSSESLFEAERPALMITYSIVPEPGAAALCLSAMGALLGFKVLASRREKRL